MASRDGVSARSDAGGRRHARNLAVANAVSTAGSVLNVVALLTYVYVRTGDSLPVGLAVLVTFLPVALVMPLISGQLARGSLRSIAIGASLLQAGLAAAMAALAAGDGWLPLLYGCASALGLLAMVQRICILSLIPRLVGKDNLAATNLMLQVSSQVGAIVGALGLALRGQAAPWVLFTIDAVSFVVQGAMLHVLLPRESGAEAARPARPAGPATSPAAPARKPPVTGLVAFLVLLPVGFTALNLVNTAVPLLALGTLDLGQRGFALAEVFYPAAAISFAFVLRRIGRLPVPAAIALVALGLAILAAAGNLTTMLVGVSVLGGAIVMSNASTQAWVQAVLPAGVLPAVQARASAMGATASAVLVLAVSAAFDAGHGSKALALLAALCAILAVWSVPLRARVAA